MEINKTTSCGGEVVLISCHVGVNGMRRWRLNSPNRLSIVELPLISLISFLFIYKMSLIS